MNRALKKTVLPLLFLLLVSLAWTAHAEVSGTTGNLSWSISDSGVLTISGSGEMRDYSYDSGDRYSSEDVDTPWWGRAFSSIVVEEGVTSIGSNAFYKASATSVKLPSTLKNIGVGAFERMSGLSDITIPEGVTSIDSDAFYCSNLITVSLPSTLKTIGRYAFMGTKLTEVALPASLISYDSTAFPTTVTFTADEGKSGQIGSLFWSISGSVLTITGSGEMPDFNRYEDTYKGYVMGYKYSMPWYQYVKDIRVVSIGSGITSIGNYAFINMVNLGMVYLPSTLKSIGAGAFDNCNKLPSLTLPSGVTTIGASAFENCRAFTSFVLPEGIETIPSNAFYYCTGLTSISIPTTVTKIGYNAFARCSNISTVLYGCTEYYQPDYYVRAYADNWSFIDFANKEANPLAVGNAPILYCDRLLMGEVHLSSGSPSVSPYAFYGCQNSFKVVANGGYSGEIGEYAFYGCTHLTGAEMPSSFKTVRQYAFYGCEELDYCYMLFDGLTYIGDFAFYGCKSLKSVSRTYTLDKPMSYIGQQAFFNCSGLTKFALSFDGATIKDSILGHHADVPTDLTEITLYGKAPASMTDGVFLGNKLTVNYYDGDSWTGKINNYGGSLTWKPVGGSSNGVNWKVTDEGTLVISGNGSVTSQLWYNQKAFIKHLEIGEEVEFIDPTLMAGLSNVNSGSMDGGDAWILTDSGILHIFGSAGMDDYVENHTKWIGKVQEAMVHSGVTSIGANAFHSELCIGMNRIILPLSIVKIGENAFAGCAELGVILLPADCTDLGAGSFQNCTSLTRIVIPEGTEVIHKDTFQGCTALTDVVFLGKIPSVYANAFTGVTATAWYPPAELPGIISSGNLTWRAYCRIEDGDMVDHVLEHFEELQPTCVAEGHIEYWHCAGCDNFFADEEASELLMAEDLPLPLTGHLWGSNPVFDWTDNGSACKVTFSCVQCDEKLDLIPEITSEILIPAGDREMGTTRYTVTVIVPKEQGVVEGKENTFHDILDVADILARFTWNATGDTITKYNMNEWEVRIPDGTKTIGTGAFANKTDLRRVFIPDSVTTIRTTAFQGCEETLTIYSSISSAAKSHADLKGIRWVECPAEMDDPDMILPANLSVIEEEAFIGLQVQVIMVPDGVTTIGDRAFANCASLRQIYLPASITSLGVDIFENCSEDLTVIGTLDTIAEEYASKYGIRFAVNEY